MVVRYSKWSSREDGEGKNRKMRFVFDYSDKDDEDKDALSLVSQILQKSKFMLIQRLKIWVFKVRNWINIDEQKEVKPKCKPLKLV